MTTNYYSNGKLLITGEYAILDGAKGLAVPTKLGQSLSVTQTDTKIIQWRSYDHIGAIWFEQQFDVATMTALHNTNDEAEKNTSLTLSNILLEARQLNPNFLNGSCGYTIATRLDFPRDWGLGSSSTLINAIAQWAQVNAFKLLWNAFSGSGYDIACAQHNSPILYHLKDSLPVVEEVTFNPEFSNQLYFIHLNQKQNSRKAIAAYRSEKVNKQSLSKRLSDLTLQFINCNSLLEFGFLMESHEAILAEALQTKTVKERYFTDYPFAIKSLGAWGGDFILVIGDNASLPYFKEKGYETIIPFSKMLL